MLISIDNADYFLAKAPIAYSGLNAVIVALFLLPLFHPKTQFLLTAMTMAAGIGWPMGMYIKYRATFGITYAFVGRVYMVIFLEFLFAGGAPALMAQIAGRPDLGWFAFGMHNLAMVVSFAGGVMREAMALELFGTNTSDVWKAAMEKRIDFARHLVIPKMDSEATRAKQRWLMKYSSIIVAGGVANIPLLFVLYGGGRNNAIFLVAPMMTGLFVYLNWHTVGPDMVRLVLLRKLEKTAGYRFINADFEKIQDLRRTFFLSRWLMKDYAVNTGAETTRRRSAKKNIRH